MASMPREISAESSCLSPVLSSSSRNPAATSRTTLEDVELSDVQKGSAEASAVPLEEDIMQCARLGETGLIQKLFDNGKFSAQYKDEEGITPLHWAAINNQYATCEFLTKAGANVNAKGGESGATPAMWAAQRCHYYVVNLLLQSGADPLLVDGQGYNILHLATIDGNAFLLVLLLHQEIPVDVTNPQGQTSLMWAAYKGFPACLDLLLKWGANVNAVDQKGLNSLHWALVKGSQPCIQKIIEYGVDRFAETAEGKSPATVAREMKSTMMWHRALSECGYDGSGKRKTLPLGLTSFIKDRQVMAKLFFLWPFLTLWVAISILCRLPIYASVPISATISFALQKAIVYIAQWGPSEYRHIHRTPFLAGVFAATLFWVGIRWLFSVLPTTFTSHAFLNLVFATFYTLTTYFFFTSLLEDPGYVPKLASRSSQRKVIEELFRLWKFDEENFCVQCMIRKPLRSKHCRRCGRCVAKHDHHCPWINNCVGNNNLRHFLLYLIFMEIGIIIFVRLVLAYIDALPPPTDPHCNILSPMLCDLILRDSWTLVLTIWVSLQLIWVTMLIAVQFVQIARNQTTYENMKRYYHPPEPHTPFLSGSTSLGPDGPTTSPSSSPPAVTTRRKDRFLARWTKLLGLDAFMVTASDASSSASNTISTTNRNNTNTSRRSRSRNPFSHGILTNCRDFWFDPAPYFRVRRVGDANANALLDGELVDYASLYELSLLGTRRRRRRRRRRQGGTGGAGFRYQQVSGGGGGGGGGGGDEDDDDDDEENAG